MTVGELRAALESIPDDRPIVVVDNSHRQGKLFDLDDVDDAYPELRERLEEDAAGPDALVFYVS